MKIKLINSSLNKKRNLPSDSYITENISLPVSGQGDNNSFVIELENEGTYTFCLTNITISEKSAIVISTNNSHGQVITKKDLPAVDATQKFYSVPLRGSSFSFKVLCRDKNEKYGFIIESIVYKDILLTLKDDIDEYGRIYSSDLKAIDPDAFKWTRPAGAIHRSANPQAGSGWVLGEGHYFVTNAHVATSVGEQSALGSFLWDKEKSLSSETLNIKCARLAAFGKQPDESDPEHNNDDYAIYELDAFDVKNSRLSDVLGGLHLNTEDESSLIGETVFPVGHSGTPQIVAYYSDEDISARKRVSIRSTFEDQILMDGYVAPGNSGSPLIYQKNGTVTGVVWGANHPVFTDGDPLYIFRGIKASHIWAKVKDLIATSNPPSFTGLAATYDVISGAYLLQTDNWKDIAEFNTGIYFRQFSGVLSHKTGYSLLKVKAKHLIDGSESELTLRLAQRTGDEMFSLEAAHGNAGSVRTLTVSCNVADNQGVIIDSSAYHMWCGLEVVSADTDDVSNYVVVSLDVTS